MRAVTVPSTSAYPLKVLTIFLTPTYQVTEQRFDALLDSLRLFNAQQGHSRVPQTFRMPHIARPLDEQSTPGRSPRYSRVRALP